METTNNLFIHVVNLCLQITLGPAVPERVQLVQRLDKYRAAPNLITNTATDFEYQPKIELDTS